MPIRREDDEATLYTDGSVDQTQAYQRSEKIFDPDAADQPSQLPRDDGTVDAAAVAATGTLTSDNTETQDGSTVTIGSVTYRIISTMAQAFDVKRDGTTADTTLLHLAKAINGDGVAGTDYFAGTTAHPYVTANETITAHALSLTAKNTGTAGNLPTTVGGGSTHLSFGAATLTGGKQAVHQGYTHKQGGAGGEAVSGDQQSHQLETSTSEDPSKAAHDADPRDI